MTSKDETYGAFVDYYGDLKMKLVKSESQWVVYGARVHSGLNINRYIFAIVPATSAMGVETSLENLDWVSLQTRSTMDTHNVPVHHLYLDDNRKKVLSDIITVVDRNNDATNYITANLPIKITLLHDKKKNNHLQYPDKAFLYQALESYNCVIEML
jgi:hypothetical protein